MAGNFGRRDLIKGASVAALLALLDARPGRAAVPDSLIEAAKKEGALLWYDGYAREDGEQVVREFQKAYPFVTKADYVELPAAQKQSRLIQECLAGGPTADIYLNGAATVQELVKQNFMFDVNWKELGIPEAAITSPNMIWIATAINCGVYNTQKISAADAPKTWDDLLDPKWKGRIGCWQRPSGIMYLAPTYGEEKTRAYARKFAALEPRLFPGTFQVSQAVGAGEIDLGIGAYDSAQRIVLKGAPLKIAIFDPVPLSLLYAGVVKFGKSPNTGKLFLAWLETKDGALAFEKATQRGHLPVKETKTAQLLEGHTHSYWTAQYEIDNADHINGFETELAKILQRRG
jgi:iron(III) transport system substrate-binding protein